MRHLFLLVAVLCLALAFRPHLEVGDFRLLTDEEVYGRALRAIDLDRDGRVSRTEFMGTAEDFAAADVDQDGYLDLAELSRAIRVAQLERH